MLVGLDVVRHSAIPSLPIARFANRRVEHESSPTLNLASPKTEHEADVMALKLFCLLSFLLVGLITAGVL
jgi:hypothetical protein